MKRSTQNKVEGKMHQAKGAMKESLGKAIGNPKLEMEGHDEKVEGQVQETIGDIEKVVGK